MSYTRKLIHPLEEQLNEAKEDGQVKQLLEEIIRYKRKDGENNIPRLDVGIDIALEKQKYQVILALPPSPLMAYMGERFLHGYTNFDGFKSFLKSHTSPQAHFYLGLKAYTQLNQSLPDVKKHLEVAMQGAGDWFPAEGYHMLGYAHAFDEKQNYLLAAQFFQEAILKSNGETYKRWNYRPYQELIFLLNQMHGLKAHAEEKWDAIHQAKDAAPVAKEYISVFTDVVGSVISFPFMLFSSAPTLADSAPKEILLTDVLRIIYFCLRQEKHPLRLFDEASFDILGYLSDHVFDELDYFANPEEAARWAETLANAAVDSKKYDKHTPDVRKSWAEKRISTLPKELERQKQLLLEQKSKKLQPEASSIEQSHEDEGFRQRRRKTS